jgi:hypothetical protein
MIRDRMEPDGLRSADAAPDDAQGCLAHGTAPPEGAGNSVALAESLDAGAAENPGVVFNRASLLAARDAARQGHATDFAEQVEAVMTACKCSYDDAVLFLEEDVPLEGTEPSAWDPEPLVSASGRARMQADVFEARERDRMRSGFYIDGPRPDPWEENEARGEDDDDPPGEEDDAQPAADDPPDTQKNHGRTRPPVPPPRAVRVRRRDLLLFEPQPSDGIHERPRTRADCGDERPCPFVSCKHHLYLESANGVRAAIRFTFPNLDVEEMAETCALDLAERGGEPDSGEGQGLSHEAIALHMNLTEGAVRTIEQIALAKLNRALTKPMTEPLPPRLEAKTVKAGKRCANRR